MRRYPLRKNETLQAWDAADELLLEQLRSMEAELPGKRLVILNDSFGALSCGLEAHGPTVYTDSYLSAQGIRINSEGRIQPLNRLEDLDGTYDLALIRVPKNMSFFEDQLCHLSAHLRPGAQVICGYMIKHQAKAAFDLLNRLIGETRTSLAQKKARLIFARLERPPTPSPYPLRVPIEGFPVPFANHSNLFSREKLDIGTRFLLENLPEGEFGSILDLGCGNGIIGIAAKQLHPAAKIVFSDESQMAIQSARACFEAYFPGEEAAFHWTHCYEDGAPGTLDLVLCNPPFHQGNTLDDQTAWQMLKDAHRALRTGGTLRVIGNSHLKHHLTMKRVFGNSEIIATNNKFMIADSIK